MNRRRMLLLVAALALAGAGLGWWLLRAPAEPAPPPAPPPAGRRALPANSEEAISRLRREIEPLREGGKSRVVYRVGSSEELEAYRHWVDAELRLAIRGVASEETPPAGFRLLELPDPSAILAEEREQKRGAGALVLRRGEAEPWLIEVPHSFFDEGTLEIGLNAFVWSQARALLVNTVHRYRARDTAQVEGAESDEDESSASDVAHAEASFFLTAHAACVDALGDVGVVQLHGFSDASAPATDLVLSPAGSRADPVPVARALERALGIRVAVYPTQIRRLGGTQNRQAHYSIAVGKPFLHVEISRSLRKQLTADPERLQRFVAALLGGAG